MESSFISSPIYAEKFLMVFKVTKLFEWLKIDSCTGICDAEKPLLSC